MPITDRDRRALHAQLENALGPAEADTLMQLLPNGPADELVTIPWFQREMQTTRAELRSEMAELRTELKTEMADLRTELKTDMAELRTEIKTEMSELRTEIKGDVLRVENSLTLRIANLHTSMNRWVIGLATANVLGMVTALIT